MHSYEKGPSWQIVEVIDLCPNTCVIQFVDNYLKIQERKKERNQTV